MEGLNMKTSTKSSRAAAVDCDDYLDLVRVFPLRQIRTAREHAAALAVLGPLISRGTKMPRELSSGESDYAGALAILVDAYEKPTRDAITAALTPLDRLRHYMEVRNMRTKDLAELVGGKSAASMILSGKRQVSREQAKKLAEVFNTDAGKFL
jgi:HTH-type transcriptional regulator/antitoxin HigA